ncbi:MAG TPA: hypothetical protein VGJ13_02255 [Pseudonocardiaceae bacterium]
MLAALSRRERAARGPVRRHRRPGLDAGHDRARLRHRPSGDRRLDDPLTVAALTTGVVLVALFVLTEWRARQPIMPLRLFASRERIVPIVRPGQVIATPSDATAAVVPTPTTTSRTTSTPSTGPRTAATPPTP